MHVAGSSLLYSRHDLPTACERLAALGFDAVDLGAFEGWAHVSPATLPGNVDTVAARVGDACDAAGLDPVALNADAGTDDPAAERRRVAALAALADRLDAPVITLQAGDPEGSVDADLDRFADLVAAVDDREATLAVETHYGTHAEDPATAARYADVPGLALTLDPSHFLAAGHAPDAYRRLLETGAVAHVHLRQSGRSWEAIQRPPDDGGLDVEQVVADLSEVGYAGALAVEYIDSLEGVDPDDAEAWAAATRERIEGLLHEAE
jgi:sugar phosphate isomerase/epimerase